MSYGLSYLSPVLSFFSCFIHSSIPLVCSIFSLFFSSAEAESSLSRFVLSYWSICGPLQTNTGFGIEYIMVSLCVWKEHGAHKVVKGLFITREVGKTGINILIYHCLLIVLKWNQVTNHPEYLLASSHIKLLNFQHKQGLLLSESISKCWHLPYEKGKSVE